MTFRDMTEEEFLAAELFNYSYDNYVDHLEVENQRFTELMPGTVRKLEAAQEEQWSKSRIAKELDVPEEEVDRWLDDFSRAKEVVHAENASESFRRAVKHSIRNALGEELDTDETIDELVIQICYRAADLGYLLRLEGKQLSDYSDWLRREKGVDYSGVGLPNLD